MEAEGGLSLVEDCGPYRSKCGYCKARGDASESHGMLAHRLSPWHYQRLLDQGWRRSGRFLYRPRNSSTCCPQYTVRLDALAFAPDREQRRALARVGRFLETGAAAAAAAEAAEAQRESSGGGGAAASPASPMEEDGKPSPRASEGECQALQQALQRALEAVLSTAAVAAASTATTATTAAPPNAAASLPAARVLPLAPHSHGSRAAPPGTAFTSASVLAAVAAVQPRPPKKKKEGPEKGEEEAANGEAAAAAAAAMATTPPGAKPKKRLRGGTGGGGAGGGSAPTSPREQQQQQQLQAGRLDPGEVAARVAALLNSHQEGGAAEGGAPLPGGLRAVAAPTGHLNFVRASGEQEPQQHKQAGKKEQQQQQQQQQKTPAAAAAAAAAAAVAAAPPDAPPSRSRRFRLLVETVPAAFDEESFALYVKYQASQHGDNPATLTRDSYRRFLVDSPLFYARPPTSGAGGQAAAQAPSFPPPPPPPPPAAGSAAPAFISERGGGAEEDARAFAPAPRGYGSYHQRYRLVPVEDGEAAAAAAGPAAAAPPPPPLVAVAVVDVLPGCLSSVYVFWDPDYAHLGLGRYTALREIEWVRRGLLFPNAAAHAAAAAAAPGASAAAAAAPAPAAAAAAATTSPLLPAFHLLNPRHYYLGYYIHSCPKMRYKGDYKPSQLLCHETGAWVPLSDAARRAIEGAATSGGGGATAAAAAAAATEYVALGRVPALAAAAKPNPSWSLALTPGAREPSGAAVPQAAVDGQPVALPAGGGGSGGGGLRVARWAAARAALRQHGLADVHAIERRLREWVAQVGLRVAPSMAEVLGELTGGGGGGGGGSEEDEEDDEDDEDDEEEGDEEEEDDD